MDWFCGVFLVILGCCSRLTFVEFVWNRENVRLVTVWVNFFLQKSRENGTSCSTFGRVVNCSILLQRSLKKRVVYRSSLYIIRQRIGLV